MRCPVCASTEIGIVAHNIKFIQCKNCLAKWNTETGLMHRGDIPEGEKFVPSEKVKSEE